MNATTMTVAVVDGYTSGRFLARDLTDRGARCVHVRSLPRLSSFLESTFDPADYEVDLGHDPDVGAVAGRLADLGVARVVAGNESGVLLADELAHRLGTPANVYELSTARRNKHRMAETLRAAGLSAPRGILAATPEEAVAWFETADVPAAVVKPVDSAGTDRVRFCHTADAVAAACELVLSAANRFGDRNRAALVQEALDGREYYVDTITVDGRHLVVATWQYTKTRTPEGGPIFDFEEPADPDAPETAALHAYVRRALDALGIRRGAAHSELVATARGPVMIDPGARLGGGILPWVTEKFLGHSHAGLLAASIVRPGEVLDLAEVLPRRWPQPIRYVSLVNHTPAAVQSPDWVRRLSSLPTALAVTNGLPAGEPVPRTHDLQTSPGHVYLTAATQAEIERDYRRIRAWEAQGLYTATEPWSDEDSDAA